MGLYAGGYSTAQQRVNESRYAAYFQDAGTRAIFSENFSSIRSVQIKGEQQGEDQSKQTCLPI